VTRQQSRRDGYLDDFVEFWSSNADTRQIWISLYTPQMSEESPERLTADDRERVIAALMHLRGVYPKLRMPEGLIKVYADPPASPGDCIFAQTTTCVSADFNRQITPCQFGGSPDCSSCGCIASAALGAVGRHRLPGGIRIGSIFEHSLAIGRAVRERRARSSSVAGLKASTTDGTADV
jgi:hypothetical protein